ncbi:MAG: FecR domain-containing protein [Alphaproteobacteria bacterium]|nr:FecR domain-containing protein [Alphaproteobacteria bacterium]MBU1515347.1 FecR domain-containing protein [Alphaproteobacteria bacterium]MBU2095397.1 FecR domain-containing protein [Alphaproteobacteria bacterium]MBU2152583.1 FecR domain-containing protein [Alphaproteobacteria bacterium]MBU2309979.1 FecR domain-containing protein [Alphaproteobacteria bacterium]
MTSMVTNNEQVMADASAWLARLQRAEVTEGDGLAFDAWLAAAPAHGVAYKRALAVWQEFESCADEVLAELAADAARPPARSGTRRWVIGAGGSAIAAGLAVAILPGLLAQPATQTYATGKGEHRKIALADGSVVDLNAETRLTVRFTRAERQVVLADGQAIFDVAHNKDRPFTVAAADRIVRVVGTQFDVRNRQGDLTVTVAAGKVQVRPASASASGHAFLLTPGQRLEIGRTGVESLAAVDPEEAMGWRSGRLVYRAEPLANVVADLNRQFVQQIEISDPELAKTPITGFIVLDEQSAVMARLSLMLPVRSIPSDRGLLLLRK